MGVIYLETPRKKPMRYSRALSYRSGRAILVIIIFICAVCVSIKEIDRASVTAQPKKVAIIDPDTTEEPKMVVIMDPDTTEEPKKVVIMGPDTTEEPKMNVIMNPDTTEETNKVVIMGPDTTEEPKKVVIMEPDTTEEPKMIVIMDPDTTEETNKVVIMDPDTTEEPKKVVVMDPDTIEESKKVVIMDPDTTKESKKVAIIDPDTHEEPKNVVIMDTDTEHVKSFLKDKVAFAMKTGVDVANDRLFAVRKAWFDRVPNRIFISDSNFQTIDGINVTNVISIAEEVMTKKGGTKTDKNKHGKRNHARREAYEFIEETEGWKEDKHKNLPGFQKLYKAYPDAEWYIMVDDDTYIFLENLAYMLSRYDSRKDFYLGYTMEFYGCNSVEGFENLFKQGGAGIILSHAAMVKMMGVVEECMWESRDCWAGDVRVATCLQHVGIKPTDSKHYLFSDHAWPNVNMDSKWMKDRSPCDLLIGNHKLSPQTLLNLREMERRVILNGKRFDLGEIYGIQYLGNQAILEDDMQGAYRIRHNQKVIGSSLEEVTTGSDLDCQRLCEVTPGCRAWTRSRFKMCSMKKNIIAWVDKNGFSSGLPYKCFGEVDS